MFQKRKQHVKKVSKAFAVHVLYTAMFPHKTCKNIGKTNIQSSTTQKNEVVETYNNKLIGKQRLVPNKAD